MTSDINGTVEGIQGNAVQAGTLGSSEDGYVLTWNNGDNQWEAKPSVGLQSQVFTSGGTWTCPTNVFNVWLEGFGGGGGGSTGSTDGDSGSGGGGSIQVSSCVEVTPGNSYSILIGSGGMGGVFSGGSGYPGNDGGTTSFGTLFYAHGAGAGQYNVGGLVSSGGTWNGGTNIAGTTGTDIPTASSGGPGGGSGYGPGPAAGNMNWFGNGSYTGGNIGTASGGYHGGSGGGAGPQGNGANGGNSGSNGSSAGNNTGAGGGGGGSAASTPGNGGDGGSGYLKIIWIG